jgi:hypothetical protein
LRTTVSTQRRWRLHSLLYQSGGGTILNDRRSGLSQLVGKTPNIAA